MKPWKKYLAVTAASLFLQVLHWALYQWLDFSPLLLALTPLLLCGAYHAVQSDTTAHRGIRRRTVFLAGVLTPLLLSLLLSLGFFLHDPDMSLYHPFAVSQGGAEETAARYAGRVMLTSLYLLVFSAPDCLLLHLQDAYQSRKAMGDRT